jgi:N-acetylmuramoyl-L-alanine amidase
MGSAGDVITLRCTAPAEAVVTATINGVTVPLSQTNANLKNDAIVYAASYRGTYTLPDAANSSTIIDMGKPVYNAEFNGAAYTATAGASIKLIGTDVPFYAEVTNELAWVYPNASSDSGSSWDLVKGQRDRVTAISVNGGWVRLACGGWVEASGVKTLTEAEYIPNPLTTARYQQSVNEDIIAWRSPYFTAVTSDFDGQKLVLRFGIQKAALDCGFSANPELFESVTASWDNKVPCCVFTLQPGAELEGYYMDYADGEVRLHIRKRKTLSVGNQPLAGFNILLDAGHGQEAPGALGPMGMDMPEKTINLVNTQKIAARLRQMGANVTFVRETDVNSSLLARTAVSRQSLPDMFISIHGNSVAETTDPTNIHGLTMWYRNAVGKPLADTFIQTLHGINPLTNRRVESNQANLYVVRPAWTPSVILETSFMCNVQDFAWMVNPARQDELAWSVVNAVLAYYR